MRDLESIQGECQMKTGDLLRKKSRFGLNSDREVRRRRGYMQKDDPKTFEGRGGLLHLAHVVGFQRSIPLALAKMDRELVRRMKMKKA
jgi:hypothetical protein